MTASPFVDRCPHCGEVVQPAIERTVTVAEYLCGDGHTWSATHDPTNGPGGGVGPFVVERKSV